MILISKVYLLYCNSKLPLIFICHTQFTLYKYINCLRPFFLLAFSSPYVSLCFDVINHCCFSKDSFFVRHYCRWWCMAWAYLVTKTISRGKEVEDYFFALAHAQQQYNGHCHFWGYDDGFLHISNRYALPFVTGFFHWFILCVYS